jgi:hypothetical protein
MERVTNLKIGLVQKNCVFVLQLDDPTDTLRLLVLFFQGNRVVLNDFSLHRYQNGTAIVIANCIIEKQQIVEVMELLRQLPGIIDVQRMEGR